MPTGPSPRTSRRGAYASARSTARRASIAGERGLPFNILFSIILFFRNKQQNNRKTEHSGRGCERAVAPDEEGGGGEQSRVTCYLILMSRVAD